MRPAPKITPKFVVAVVEQAREIATEEACLRIPSRLGMAFVLVSVTLMGWGVMRSTRGQDVPKPTVPATSLTAPSAPRTLQGNAKQAETAKPFDPEVVPESSVPKLPETRGVELPFLGTPSSAIPAATPAPPSDANDDPEKTVQAFVEQNRKVAEGQLKSLKEEEAKLRARLQKVEGGIKRWEALLTALEKSAPAASSKGLTLTDPRDTAKTDPRSLQPAPAEPRDKPHTDGTRDRSPVEPSPLPPDPATTAPG